MRSAGVTEPAGLVLVGDCMTTPLTRWPDHWAERPSPGPTLRRTLAAAWRPRRRLDGVIAPTPGEVRPPTSPGGRPRHRTPITSLVMNGILRQIWLAVRPITAQQRFLWW